MNSLNPRNFPSKMTIQAFKWQFLTFPQFSLILTIYSNDFISLTVKPSPLNSNSPPVFKNSLFLIIEKIWSRVQDPVIDPNYEWSSGSSSLKILLLLGKKPNVFDHKIKVSKKLFTLFQKWNSHIFSLLPLGLKMVVMVVLHTIQKQWLFVKVSSRGYKITNRNLDLQIILRKTRWFLSRCKRLWFLLLLLEWR